MTVKAGLQYALLCVGLLLLGTGIAIPAKPTTRVDELSSLALSLAVVLTAAKLGGDLAARLGQAPVLGELLAGVLLGALPGLDAVRTDAHLDALARLGMLLLLFEVGLELSVSELFAVGPSSVLVALVGSLSSFAMGWAVAAVFLPEASGVVHLFVGAAITATSVGITARVLKDMDASRTQEAKIILGAAVVDDVLALVALALVTGFLASPSAAFPFAAVTALMTKTLGFLVLAIVLGVKLTPIWFRFAARLHTSGALLAVGLCFCFLVSGAAGLLGLAPLVGAFAAGLVLEDTHSKAFVERGERPLGQLLEPITSFLVPVFFVLIGIQTNVRALGHPFSLGLPLALTAAAVIGKLAAGLGVLAGGARKRTVAAAMVPRGEVSLVFAALGTALRMGDAPLLDQRAYLAIVTVVILTTLLTPSLLRFASAQGRGPVASP